MLNVKNLGPELPPFGPAASIASYICQDARVLEKLSQGLRRKALLVIVINIHLIC